MAEPLQFDVVIYGATPPGVVAAVRAAREGLRVALVSPDDHIGGSFPSLGAVETHYRGVRAPLLREFTERVSAHYRECYGDDSEAWRACVGGNMVTFEPHVAERVLREWLVAESRIHCFWGFEPATVECDGSLMRAVRFIAVTGAERAAGEALSFVAPVFLEAGDTGDLMAAAGVSHRIGREGRAEFGEPSAGRVFTRWVTGRFPRAAAEGRLNLTTAGATTSEPLPGSTGEGDDNVQSYSYRLCLTNDPANRRRLDTPPPGYDRERFAPILLSPEEKERLPLPFHHRFLIYELREMVTRDHLFHGHALPNRKRSWNATNLTGAGKRYATGTAADRRAIERQHRDHALGLMYFLQNDPAMPADLRAQACEWGLARDEFVTTDNLPPVLYVREARRLVGRAVFTERDALAARSPTTSSTPAELRAPVHADAIGITDFSLDSLACTTERLPGAGALCDGQLFQMEVSRPGQVPYGVLLPREIDNLLVVNPVSATHVGWGTLRQTPTLMHLAESAAWAVVRAARHHIPPAAIDVTELQCLLLQRGVMITFFNDLDGASTDSSLAAMQFLGTRGFFESYDARPLDPLTPETAAAWSVRAAGRLNLPRFSLPPGLTRSQASELIFSRLRSGQTGS